jgi:hypothetical protein
VTVRFIDSSTNVGSGEIDPPSNIVMTRKFQTHPLQGKRETTITYRLDPVMEGIPVTVASNIDQKEEHNRERICFSVSRGRPERVAGANAAGIAEVDGLV